MILLQAPLAHADRWTILDRQQRDMIVHLARLRLQDLAGDEGLTLVGQQRVGRGMLPGFRKPQAFLEQQGEPMEGSAWSDGSP